MNENIIVPHPLHPLLADRNRGRGRPDSNNRKNSDKGVFCCFFCNYIFYGSKWSNIFRGGATFYLFIYLSIYFILFFFFGGGGSGGGKSLFNLYNKTYITCDFSGGGGPVRTTYPSLDPRMGKK